MPWNFSLQFFICWYFAEVLHPPPPLNVGLLGSHFNNPVGIPGCSYIHGATPVCRVWQILTRSWVRQQSRTSGAGAPTVVRCATKLWVPQHKHKNLKIQGAPRCAFLGIQELSWVRHCHTLHSGGNKVW